ncbi:hypothetical protein PYW08_004375 [Mythimna loreyi]|uniref:Uncharacterized protein n=1 Tax=Mythimna loreyi TaxID=667449 RepID=A0ACC2QPA2_9NEOP|nr:hypothetical protein PYW08_004375 [Mythimna loreyi]
MSRSSGDREPRYQALVGGCEPLQSYLHKRLAENLNSEAALGTVGDVAQCVQWLRSTFLYVRAARDPKKYLNLPQNSPQHLISKKIEELCVKAMNGLASSGLITMDEASCIESTEAGRLMSVFYLDLETMKQIMKINGTESLERLLVLICESHELADMHLRVDERRCLNLLNRNSAAATIRFPMKGKITTRQMKLNCIIQAVLGCLSIPDPSLNQEAMKIMRIADRICKCLVIYVTRPDLISQQPQFFSAVLNSILLAKCVAAHLWENSPYVSKQLKGIGPTFSTLLASAGKINFMLLEESHPRDLERIMNKGPPAGNVLRKQVSLLPKYQLTMIPVDEKTVTVQLVLLNKSHLAENMENLTAGDSHKSYIIVGDSNNNLLLLVAFKDRDLISVFDGIITHEAIRKHSFEHKIFAHCVSSSVVGIDVQSEYMFNDLEPFLRGLEPGPPVLTNAMPSKRTAERQTCITDTFKERKRKVNPDAIEKSKEKKKRENGILENFKYLKQSFETASKNVNKMQKQNEGNFNKDTNTCLSSKTINNTNAININSIKEKENIISDQNICFEEIDNDEFIDDEKIDSILNEIENEMGKNKISIDKAVPLYNNPYSSEKYLNVPNSFSTKLTVQNSTTKPNSKQKLNIPRKSKPKTAKSNYTFIELLERNLSLSDDEEKAEAPQNNNGFSDTIKCQIQKYLTKTQTKTVIPDRNINILLDKYENGLASNDEKTHEVETINLDSEILNSPAQSNYPRYEIKEILGGQNFTQHNIKKNPKLVSKVEENLMNKSNSKNCDILESVNNIKDDGTRIHNIETEDSMAYRNMNTVIIDDADDRRNSDTDMKEDNLDDTLILNFDKTSKTFANQENVKNEVDNKNEFDNIICVEEYNFKQDNNECSNNILDPDVIMVSPNEISENPDRNNRNINDQGSDLNTNNFAKENIIADDNNSNANYVFDNNKFQDLYKSVKTDTPAKYSCSDVKDKYQHVEHKSPTPDKSSILQDIRPDLELTEIDVPENSCSDISIKDRRHLVSYNMPIHDKKTIVEDNTGRNPRKFTKAEDIEKNVCSNIVLKNMQFAKNHRESYKENQAIEDNKIGYNLYIPSNLDALTIMPCKNVVLKERNHRVGNKRVFTIEDNNINYNRESTKVDTVSKNPSSEDITLNNENQRASSEAQCNKTINYSPVSNDPSYNLENDSENKLSNLLKNVENNKQKTEYVKRYTYSTSKVDVCTKKTEDYCVQVIKKVKMDLDITAIVSRKHNSSQNYREDSEETCTNNKRIKLIELPNQDIPFQNTAEDANKIIATVNNDIANKLPPPRLCRPEFPRVKNAFKPPYKAQGVEEPKNNHLQMIKASKEYKTRECITNENQSKQNDEVKLLKDPKEKQNKPENDNYEDTGKKLRESESGNNSVTSDNKIKNLLQKYSKILAKNAVKTITPSCSGFNESVIAGEPTARKSQKPFKITDIHKLHAELPESIVNNKPVIETNISQPLKLNCFEAKNRRVDANSRPYAHIIENKPIDEMNEYKLNDLDLEPIHLPKNIDLEPSKDYKIDQSMFDPKTLLQSVADDESDEIVPPPPEFCDDVTYASGYDKEKVSMADNSITDRAPQNDMFTENNMEYNENIFDDCFAKNLSSSTEIETWNLSQEDSWEPCNVTNLSPTGTFTIMRKNNKNDFGFMQNSLLSRQERLKKFRFNQKNKLKIRK